MSRWNSTVCSSTDRDGVLVLDRRHRDQARGDALLVEDAVIGELDRLGASSGSPFENFRPVAQGEGEHRAVRVPLELLGQRRRRTGSGSPVESPPPGRRPCSRRASRRRWSASPGCRRRRWRASGRGSACRSATATISVSLFACARPGAAFAPSKPQTRRRLRSSPRPGMDERRRTIGKRALGRRRGMEPYLLPWPATVAGDGAPTAPSVASGADRLMIAEDLTDNILAAALDASITLMVAPWLSNRSGWAPERAIPTLELAVWRV